MLNSSRHRRHFVSVIRAGLFSWIGLYCTAHVQAQSTPAYYRIEQDWKLVVSTPNSDQGTPNIVVAMTPQASTNIFANLLINYGSTPSYSAGGFQTQLWNGSTLVSSGDYKSNKLNYANESITFTTYLNYTPSTQTLEFGVVNGSSQSFGSFTNCTPLVLTYVPQAALSSALAAYSTTDTISNSEIVAGAEQVSSLTITAVRKYYNSTTSNGNSKKVSVNTYVDTEGSQKVF